jgi:hypothetical protein
VGVHRPLDAVAGDERGQRFGRRDARLGHADALEGRRETQRGLGDPQHRRHVLRETAAGVVVREAIGPSPGP